MGQLARAFREGNGQSAVWLAVFLGMLALGFMALAVDTGYFFHEKRMAQSAADAASIAAAEEASAGEPGNMQAAANALAKMNGFDSSAPTYPATVQINSPPKYGNYAGSSGYTEVIVSRQIPTLLLGVVNPSKATLTVGARAVSGGGQSAPTCICLEAGSGMGLNMSNDAQLSASNCGITVDSRAVLRGGRGSAGINALSLGTVSTNWDNSSNVNNGGTISSTTKVVTGVQPAVPRLPLPPCPTARRATPTPFRGGPRQITTQASTPCRCQAKPLSATRSAIRAWIRAMRRL